MCFTISIFGKLIIISRACFSFSLHFQLLKLWYHLLNLFFISAAPSTPLASACPVLVLLSTPPLHTTTCFFFFLLVEWFINSFMMLVFVNFLWRSLEAFRDFGGGITKAKKAIYCEKFHRNSREPCDSNKLWPSIFLKIERCRSEWAFLPLSLPTSDASPD